jgi:hypothetical protein
MRGKPVRRKGEPVLLLDPEIDRAAKLAAQLELIGFPTRTESTGAGALAAIKDSYFATLLSPRCDAKTCNLIYRHGGDACLTASASIDELTQRLTALQLRARPFY